MDYRVCNINLALLHQGQYNQVKINVFGNEHILMHLVQSFHDTPSISQLSPAGTECQKNIITTNINRDNTIFLINLEFVASYHQCCFQTNLQKNKQTVFIGKTRVHEGSTKAILSCCQTIVKREVFIDILLLLTVHARGTSYHVC